MYVAEPLIVADGVAVPLLRYCQLLDGVVHPVRKAPPAHVQDAPLNVSDAEVVPLQLPLPCAVKPNGTLEPGSADQLHVKGVPPPPMIMKICCPAVPSIRGLGIAEARLD